MIMKIANVLNDWFLGKREVQMLILETKTAILLPKNYKEPNTIIYANGFALKIESKIVTSYREIKKNYDYELPKRLGIKSYEMPASCEHPEYTVYSHCDQSKCFEYFFDATKDYIVDTMGYSEDEQITFYNIKVLNLSQYYEKYNTYRGRRRL